VKPASSSARLPVLVLGGGRKRDDEDVHCSVGVSHVCEAGVLMAVGGAAGAPE
jgi:hypothetical protein